MKVLYTNTLNTGMFILQIDTDHQLHYLINILDVIPYNVQLDLNMETVINPAKLHTLFFLIDLKVSEIIDT